LFARPDPDRIKEVGPNRACAEWLLRCGATFKWKGFDRFQTDYHALPASDFRSFVIEEVEAVEAGIMRVGFEHFGTILSDITLISSDSVHSFDGINNATFIRCNVQVNHTVKS